MVTELLRIESNEREVTRGRENYITSSSKLLGRIAQGMLNKQNTWHKWPDENQILYRKINRGYLVSDLNFTLNIKVSWGGIQFWNEFKRTEARVK